MIAELKTWLAGVCVAAGLPERSVFTEAEDLERKNPLPNAVILSTTRTWCATARRSAW